MSWPLVRLGDVSRFIRGVTFKPVQLVDVGSVYSTVCMRTKNVQKKLDESDLIAIPDELIKNSDKNLNEGDLLISTANSFELVGKACWVPNLGYKAAAGGFISILRGKTDKIYPRYLYHWIIMPSTQHSLRYCGRQTTNISNMDYGRALELKTPLPPLPEQKRIAKILDKADAIHQKRQQAIKLADEFLRAVFLDMFGDPVTNPKCWNVLELQNVVDKVIDCPHSTPSWKDNGKIAIRTSNLTVGGWNWDDTRYVNEEEFEERSKRGYVEVGDIILSREGTVGVVAIVQEGMEICLGQRLVQLKPNNNIANSEYILNILLYELHPERLESVMVGATSKHLNVKDLRALKIPVPPLNLQREFEIVANKLKNNIKTMLSASSTDNSLFNSLSQKAFAGEL